jgi:hypothetical protein
MHQVIFLYILATDPEVRVRLPAPPDFLRSSGFGTGPTQPRDYNWDATWKNKIKYGRINSGSGLENGDHGRRDLWRWPRGILSPQKLALTSTSVGRSVYIVPSRTQATEFFSLVFTVMFDVRLNTYQYTH